MLQILGPVSLEAMVRKSVLHRTEDVLMLFRYTENPPENIIFPPAALRVSTRASAYTENSSFPYTPNVVALTPAALLLLIAGIRKRVPFRTLAGPAAIRSAFLIEAD